MQTKYDAQALVASRIIQKVIFNILEHNLFDNLFNP
jgi:retron-type reverse transcriptase